jgi:hypothetical protein
MRLANSMRLANYANRATAVLGDAGAERTPDIANASGGRSRPDIAAVDDVFRQVFAIGRSVSGIDESAPWSSVAGLTVEQDISERLSQIRGPAAQFGLGKRDTGFSPQGAWLVTLDEFNDVDDLELGYTLDGEEVQKGQTRPDLLGAEADRHAVPQPHPSPGRCHLHRYALRRRLRPPTTTLHSAGRTPRLLDRRHQ